jgi:hypothetical protein
VEKAPGVSRPLLCIAFSILSISCSSTASKNGNDRAICEKDDQCAAGQFCDRGICAITSTDPTLSPYGIECVPTIVAPGDDVSPPQAIGRCRNIYLCVDGRCRSCAARSDCQGSRECRTGGGRYSGEYCWDPNQGPPSALGLDAMGMTNPAPNPDGGSDASPAPY